MSRIDPQGLSLFVIPADRNRRKGGLAYLEELTRRPLARLLCPSAAPVDQLGSCDGPQTRWTTTGQSVGGMVNALTRAYRVRPDYEAGLRKKYFVETQIPTPW